MTGSDFDKVLIRVGGRNWIDVTDETVAGQTFSLDQILETNGQPERIATSD